VPLITDGKLKTGFLRDRIIISLLRDLIMGEEARSNVMYVPKPVFNYARKISEITGLPLHEVLKSEPVKKLIKRWTEYVEVKA